MNKTILGLAFFVLVGIVMVSGCTSTSSQKYNGNGYTFQYPSGWSATDSGAVNSSHNVTFSNMGFSKGSFHTEPISNAIYNGKPANTSAKYIDSFHMQPTDWKHGTKNGMDYYQLQGSNTGSFFVKGNVYSFDVIGHDKQSTDNFNMMVNSFKVGS